jgi:phosphoribosylformylglycinamidine synthase
MTTYRIEIRLRAEQFDPRGEAVRRDISDLGIPDIVVASVSDLYFLRGDLRDEDVRTICRELLADPITQEWVVERSNAPTFPRSTVSVEVTLRPGVTDTQAEALLHGAQVIGVQGVQQARTGLRYELTGDLTEAQVHRIARRLLCNDAIQTYTLGQADPAFAPPDLSRVGHVEVIPLREASDTDLERISADRRLSLNLVEMQAIRAYFRDLGRDPTDLELETLAQTWSEHCGHKTFKGRIERRSPALDDGRDWSLLDYIRRASEAANRPWVRSAFVDNAGIIDFDDALELSVKVETHNHPSAIEPFGGANTGVGGVVRDIIGVSARPIAATDVLCFGPQDLDFADLPAGVLHPRRIASGVVHGIEDYGNKLGVPVVNGAVLYDEGYVGNPLVYCGCLGIAPKGLHRTEPRPGDAIVLVGGRTGRDGLRGATFSSLELTHETGEVAGSAVQIGDPITEKKMLEAILMARDERLYSAITDCGGGGLSSAVGEMAAELGAIVLLDRVPLKYQGLAPWEIWLSEAQERMILAVPPENVDRVIEICADLDVEATVIGHFTGDGRLTLRYEEKTVSDLGTAFLHGGCPRRHLVATWERPDAALPDFPCPDDLVGEIESLLNHPAVRSRESIIRRYDHEVQGGTFVKPLVGPAGDGPSDAAVIKPLEGEGWRGVAVGCGINPRYGVIDPWAMAVSAVDEALRNVVAVGADPDRVALLDNFCWGDPDRPDRLGGLLRAAEGCYDGAVPYGLPFISGKDSLNNEYVDAEGKRRPIPGTLLMTAVGIVPDVRRAVTMDLKEPGNLLYLVGQTRNEVGGALYYTTKRLVGGRAPGPAEAGPRIVRALHRAMREGIVRACHDLSEGGLGVAAAEMARAGRLGVRLDLSRVPRDADVTRADTILFSESNGRFLVEVRPEEAAAFESALAGCPFARVGEVVGERIVSIEGVRPLGRF